LSDRKSSPQENNHGFWSRRFALAAGNPNSDHPAARFVLAPLIGSGTTDRVRELKKEWRLNDERQASQTTLIGVEGERQ
jgi:hypothetical protein